MASKMKKLLICLLLSILVLSNMPEDVHAVSQVTTYSEYPFARKESINYTLWKNRFGFDKEIGTISSSADSSIYGSFGSIDSGEYYLKVWKTNIDYHHTSGEGKVSN